MDFAKELDEGDFNNFYAREKAAIRDLLLQVPVEFHAVATREVQLTAFKHLHVLASNVSSAVDALMCNTLAPMIFLKALLEDEST